MTRLVRFSNTAISRLSANITNLSTTISLTPGDGDKFPVISGMQFFMATLIKVDGTTEIIKVTARSSDTLTVVRAAEPVGSAQVAYAFSAGDRIEQRLTAKALSDELDRLDSGSNIGTTNKTANYTVLVDDVSTLIRVDSTAGIITVTLPQISSLNDDFDIMVAKITGDSNTVNVVRSGSTDLINGLATYSLNKQWQSAWLIADRSSNTWTAINSGATGVNAVVDSGVGSGSATITLSGNPLSINNTAFFVGGIYQQKATYSLSDATLTAGDVIASGVNWEVVWTEPFIIGTPSDGSVSTIKLADGALAASTAGRAKMANGFATPAKLSTGAPTWNANGNMGLGVTPSAWSFNGIDIGNAGYGGTGNGAYISYNAFYDGVWKYKTNGLASYYSNSLGEHSWYSAPSGTAGNAVSFTQVMSLSASGVLSVPGGITGTASSVADDAITTAKLQNNAVTPAKLAQPFTRGTAVNSTSGTAIDFAGIPSWAKRIRVVFLNVGLSGESGVWVRIGGASSGVQSSGYKSAVSLIVEDAAVTCFTSTSGFFAAPSSGVYNLHNTLSGFVEIVSISANNWVATSSCGYSGNSFSTGGVVNGGGSMSLSEVLTTIRVITDGTKTFDEGSINIFYE